MNDGEDWLAWAKRVRAIAQTGIAYGNDAYDLDRYRELQGMAEEMLAAVTALPLAGVRDLYLPEQGYPTPKVDVRAGVFRVTGGGAEVLLVREESDGRWSLPGGWADEQESPRQGIEREVIEESGYRVRAVKLVALKDRALHGYVPRRLEHIYKLFFLCELEGGAGTDSDAAAAGSAAAAEKLAAASIETTDAGFFALDDLPELSLGRTLPEDIELLDAHRRQPDLPVAFD